MLPLAWQSYWQGLHQLPMKVTLPSYSQDTAQLCRGVLLCVRLNWFGEFKNTLQHGAVLFGGLEYTWSLSLASCYQCWPCCCPCHEEQKKSEDVQFVFQGPQKISPADESFGDTYGEENVHFVRGLEFLYVPTLLEKHHKCLSVRNAYLCLLSDHNHVYRGCRVAHLLCWLELSQGVRCQLVAVSVWPDGSQLSGFQGGALGRLPLGLVEEGTQGCYEHRVCCPRRRWGAALAACVL